MCDAVYFRNVADKASFIEIIDMINREGLSTDYWGFFTAVCRTDLSYFIQVKIDFIISGGKYLYICCTSETDALAYAGKIRAGSLVVPDRDTSDYWFVMRVD
jgi:hypothetical protein